MRYGGFIFKGENLRGFSDLKKKKNREIEKEIRSKAGELRITQNLKNWCRRLERVKE